MLCNIVKGIQMKKLLVKLFLSLTIIQSQAQQPVNFKGQIKNTKADEVIYLVLDGVLIRLQVLEDGTFSTNTSIQELPSFYSLANIAKNGKIEQQTPRIWFNKDSIDISINWADKTFQPQEKMPYQSLSEKIESLKTDAQNEFILNHTVNIPILYFVNKNKKSISIADLDLFTQKVDDTYKSSFYFKRLENYLWAKKRKLLKVGEKVEDFSLPDKDGNQVSVINSNNKTKLITIFSSGCSYSIASISMLEKISKMNTGKIEIITIWADDIRDTWLTEHADKKSNMSWTNLWDEHKFASTYFNNTSWPTFYVVDAQGKLVDQFKSYNQKTANKLKALVE